MSQPQYTAVAAQPQYVAAQPQYTAVAAAPQMQMSYVAAQPTMVASGSPTFVAAAPAMTYGAAKFGKGFGH